MFWLITAILIAAFIIWIAWKWFKTVLHVAVIAIVLAAGVILVGYHQFHLPKGINHHGYAVLASMEYAASSTAGRLRHGLANWRHP